MDRSIENDDRQPDGTAFHDPEQPQSRPQGHREKPKEERSQPGVERQAREYHVSDAQRHTMAEIGRFRAPSVEDLALFGYDGDHDKMQQDIRHLVSQRLVRTRTVWLGKDKDPLVVVALTKQGKQLLERSGEEGTFYSGFVKRAEMVHDAAIYRMYQAEAQRIAKQGGQIRGISLDYELKRRVYSMLAKEKPGTSEYKKRQAEIASEHGLKVVRGHIQLPDLRIEYLTRDGEIAQTDLELATTHYRGGSLAAKAEAGFTFYASGADASRLSRVFDDHDIMAEILSL